MISEFSPLQFFTTPLTRLYQEFKLFVRPNPTNDKVMIICKDLPEESNLRISDINGKVVHSNSQFKERTILNTELWPEGMYIIEVDSPNGGVHSKLIVNH